MTEETDHRLKKTDLMTEAERDAYHADKMRHHNLRLHGSGVSALLAGGEVDHQQVLLDFDRATRRQLNDIARFTRRRLILRKSDSSARH